MAASEPEEPEKPRPRGRHKPLSELRSEVKAKDKFAIAAKPEEEAVELVQDGYKADLESARAFVRWIKGTGSGESKAPPRGVPLETWHRRGDEEAGEEPLLTDAESEKARAKATKGKKKS